MGGKVFGKIEKEVMLKLLDGQDDNLAVLRDQYAQSAVKKREYSGTGFFTSFEIPDDISKLKTSKSIQLGDVVAEIKGVKDGVGFVLFIKNGVIDFLEGYTYGEEKWPKEISEYKLSYFSGLKRDMKKLQEKW
ncbi:MAG: hypothetical protein ABFC84_14675 [Veillonellales bacterium]